MQLKSTQSISYKKLAAEKGISTRRVSQIIGMVKEYIKNNPTLQLYKSVLNKEDWYANDKQEAKKILQQQITRGIQKTEKSL